MKIRQMPEPKIQKLAKITVDACIKGELTKDGKDNTTCDTCHEIMTSICPLFNGEKAVDKKYGK